MFYPRWPFISTTIYVLKSGLGLTLIHATVPKNVIRKPTPLLHSKHTSNPNGHCT